VREKKKKKKKNNGGKNDLSRSNNGIHTHSLFFSRRFWNYKLVSRFFRSLSHSTLFSVHTLLSFSIFANWFIDFSLTHTFEQYGSGEKVSQSERASELTILSILF
jgi:hypothetical protein